MWVEVEEGIREISGNEKYNEKKLFKKGEKTSLRNMGKIIITNTMDLDDY